MRIMLIYGGAMYRYHQQKNSSRHKLHLYIMENMIQHQNKNL